MHGGRERTQVGLCLVLGQRDHVQCAEETQSERDRPDSGLRDSNAVGRIWADVQGKVRGNAGNSISKVRARLVPGLTNRPLSWTVAGPGSYAGPTAAPGGGAGTVGEIQTEEGLKCRNKETFQCCKCELVTNVYK